MLVALFSWVYIFFITYSLGHVFYEVWAFFRTRDNDPKPAATLLSLTGFCLLTGFLGIYSLFLPITQTANLALFLILFGYAVFRWPVYRQLGNSIIFQAKGLPWYWWLFLTLFFIKVLFLSVAPPVNYDVGFYYAQTLKWLETYSVVPGLGNLHGRLAFNSSFFQISAFFSFSSIFGQPILVLNGWLYLLLALIIVQELNAFLQFVFLFFLGLTFFMFSVWLSSASPDLTITVLKICILLLIIKQAISGSAGNAAFNLFLILILIFVCLTVKLSSAPFIMFVFYLFSLKQLRFKNQWLVLLFGIVLFFMAPWFARNIIQSGYLVYPLPAVDIFNFDWKIPKSEVIIEKDFIRYYAISKDRDWHEVATYPFVKWFPFWWNANGALFQVCFMLAILSTIFVSVSLLFKSGKLWFSGLNSSIKVVWLINLAGLLFWFINAPDPRFGIIYVLVVGFFPILLLLGSYAKQYHKAMLVFLIFINFASTFFSLRDDLYLFRHNKSEFVQRLKLPVKIEAVALKSEYLGSVKIWMPSVSIFCYDAPIPCTHVIQEGLELRGKNIADGFRINIKVQEKANSRIVK